MERHGNGAQTMAIAEQTRVRASQRYIILLPWKAGAVGNDDAYDGMDPDRLVAWPCLPQGPLS